VTPPDALPPAPLRVRIAGWVGVVVVAFGIAVVAVGGWQIWSMGQPDDIPRAPRTPVADLTGDVFVSPSPAQPRASHRSPTGAPLIGAGFDARDSVQDSVLRGLPFTFRMPRLWTCPDVERYDATTVHRCHDAGSGKPPDAPHFHLVALRCPTACTQAERGAADQRLAAPPTYRERDAATRIAESTAGGRYRLTVNRVYATVTVDRSAWVIVVDAHASAASAPAVQKIVNDIYAQTA
jgi:hypothetical protein